MTNIDKKSISKNRKKIQKEYEVIASKFIEHFKKELGENKDPKLSLYLDEKLLSGFDTYKAGKSTKEKEKIANLIAQEIISYSRISDSDSQRSIINNVSTIYTETYKNLQREEINEMNYQIMRVNMITPLSKTLAANILKSQHADIINTLVDSMFESLENIGYSWIKIDMLSLLNNILDIIIYSVKANYFEPDVSYASLEGIFTSSCERFLTVLPAYLLLEGLKLKLKNQMKTLDQNDFDKILKITEEKIDNSLSK